MKNVEQKFKKLYPPLIARATMADVIKDETAKTILADLGKIKQPSKLTMTLYAVRAKLIDAFAKSFLVQNPYGAIITVAVGFDTRRERIDNGKATFIEVDTGAVISRRRKLFKTDERTIQIVSDPYDKNWLTKVDKTRIVEPVLIIAEGFMPYIEYQRAVDLFLGWRSLFGRADVIFDAYSAGGAAMKKAKWGMDVPEEFSEMALAIQFVGAVHLEDDDNVKKLPKATRRRYEISLTLNTVALPERVLIYRFLSLLDL